MQIITTDTSGVLEFTKAEGGGKLFYNLLPRLEFLRIAGSPENIKKEINNLKIDKKGLTEDEIKEQENKQASLETISFIVDNAIALICETNTVTGWEDFIDINENPLKFSQELLKSFIANCDMVKLLKVVNAITDNLYAVKKKVVSKQKKKTQKKNSKD